MDDELDFEWSFHRLPGIDLALWVSIIVSVVMVAALVALVVILK